MSFSQSRLRVAEFDKAGHVLNKGRDLFMYSLFLFFPILNAIADSTIYYFIDAYDSGLHLGLIRGGFLLLFIAVMGLGRILKCSINYVIIIFLFYLFLLSILSSNVNHSLFDGYLKWFVGLMMFPAGYWFFGDYESVVKYNFILVFAALIICINLLIAQFTGYGMSAYGGEDFYTGGAGVGISNQLALILLTYPVLIRNFDKFSHLKKMFIIIVGVLSLIFLILSMKRAGIIALAGGSIVFILITQSRTKAFKYIITGFLVILMTLPLYKNILVKRYEARVSTFEKYDSEARYLEVFYVLDEFRDGNVWQKLFGKEAFNTGQFFGMKYFKRPRMIHGDFAALFYGTGIVGLGLYFSLFFTLFKRGVSKIRLLARVNPSREMLAVFIGLLFATFIISATGSGTIGERCLVYSYFGAVLGSLKTLKQNQPQPTLNMTS